MKTTDTIFIGVLVCGLITSRAPLHAQPETTGLSISIEGDDKPWNQGVPIATRQAAREVFLEGNRLFNIPLFSQAAEKYLAALAQWKHPAFYFNLALTQLNLGQDVEAHENLLQAMRLGVEPLGADHFEEAQKQLQELERKLGRIRITCQIPGAEITLDGAPLFTSPGTHDGWVKAKDHEITARAQGYLSEARRVTVSPGTPQEIDLRLVTLSEAADTGRRWAVWKPWAVVAAGVTVAAGGGVLHALSSRSISSFDKDFQKQPCAQGARPACPDRVPQAPAPSDLYNRLDLAKREQAIAVGGYVGGGLLLTIGIVLLYMNRPHLIEQESASPHARSVTIAPIASSDALGITVSISH